MSDSRSDDRPVEDATPAAPAGTGEQWATLRRIEELLAEIRARLDTVAQLQQHREFSLARLIGAVLQALVVGLIIAAFADWAFQAPPVQQLIKLLFAGVLQLGVLTAFIVARE